MYMASVVASVSPFVSNMETICSSVLVQQVLVNMCMAIINMIHSS